jgi:hypothetical protein
MAEKDTNGDEGKKEPEADDFFFGSSCSDESLRLLKMRHIKSSSTVCPCTHQRQYCSFARDRRSVSWENVRMFAA